MLFAAVGTAIQWFWAWRWDGVSVEGQPPLKEGTGHPFGGCTVVTCFYNEASQVTDFALKLKPCLKAARAKGLSVEVVTVNHGSTDQTLDLLEKEAAQEKDWRVLHVNRTREGKKQALAEGVAAASTNTLVVMDADCRPLHPHWLLHMTAEAGTAWDVHVGISLPSAPPHSSLRSLLQRIEAQRLAQRAVGAVQARHPYLGFGRNMAFTRDIWDLTQGMEGHEDLISGDDDLWLQKAVLQSAKVKACLPHEGQTSSQWPDTWEGWRRQKTRHFTASVAYPRSTLFRLGMPGMGWMLLAAGVVHNPTGTSMGLAASAVLIRTLTFGLFLHRMGQPFHQAWTLLLEPAISLFRGWAWWKGQNSDLTPWK